MDELDNGFEGPQHDDENICVVAFLGMVAAGATVPANAQPAPPIGPGDPQCAFEPADAACAGSHPPCAAMPSVSGCVGPLAPPPAPPPPIDPFGGMPGGFPGGMGGIHPFGGGGIPGGGMQDFGGIHPVMHDFGGMHPGLGGGMHGR